MTTELETIVMHGDFEKDLKLLFEAKMREHQSFCEQIWSALANVVWRHENGEEYSCSFRYAGGLIADIIGEGGYMDWYCSGPYETVSEEIETAMKNIGWTHHAYDA